MRVHSWNTKLFINLESSLMFNVECNFIEITTTEYYSNGFVNDSI